MAQFISYTYEFSPIDKHAHANKDLFGNITSLSVRETMERKREFFRYSLKNAKYMHYNKHLKTQILYDKDELFLFKLANNKVVELEEDFVKKTTISEPSILVFVDNRESIQRILIEDNTLVFSKTSVVSNIIKRAVSKSLEKNNLNISIKQEFDREEFWSVVNSNSITMLRFEFDYPNLARSRMFLRDEIKNVTQSIGASSSKTQFDAAGGEVLNIDRSNSEIVALNESSADTGSKIKYKILGSAKIHSVGETKKTLELDLNIEGESPSSLEETLNILKHFTENG